MEEREISKGKNMSVFIQSNGCIPNRLEGKKISSFFSKIGWDIIGQPEKADVIIFNSCGYSGTKMEESHRLLEGLIKVKQKGCRIYLAGCIDRIQPDFRRDFKSCSVIDISELGRTFNSEIMLDGLFISNNLIDILDTAKKDIYNIVTSKGCVGKCSYCAIRKARGLIKSKPEEAILDEFRQALGTGFRKFILWGDDLGAYGLDISSTYINLLKSLIGAAPDGVNYRFFLHRLNAQWIINHFAKFEEILATEKIKLIYSPIQSGSNRILKIMNRNYEIEEVKKCFQLIKYYFPQIVLKTDIMVGFPTETEQDFAETLNAITEIKIDDIAVFKYSGVPNTPAYSMEGQIEEEEKEQRIQHLWKKFPQLRFSLEHEDGQYWVIDKEKCFRVPLQINCYTAALG